MRFFLLFFFGWFISDSMGNDLDFDYTQKGNFGSYTVKGRLSDPSYKNDYVYLRYLSNILYQEFLNQIDGADFMASLNDWNEKFTEYNKSCLISQVTRRMSFIMLGAGSGIKSRPLDQINPEHFWQPIQAIRLMMASARKAEFHFGFKDWFIRMHGAAKDHIKKHNVDDAAYERHIKILTAIGVATEAAYYSQADDITHDVKEAVKKVIKDDEALLTKVYQYLEHYGLFEKEIMPFSKQIERVGDFMTFRKKHHEPARLAIGVSNLLKDSQEMGEERQRFKDPSWIPVNVRKDFFNPAGIPYLVMDAGSTKAWDNEIKPLRDKSLLFDEITFDDGVVRHVPNLSMDGVQSMALSIKKGGTFQYPANDAGFHYPKKEQIQWTDDFNQDIERDIETWPARYSPQQIASLLLNKVKYNKDRRGDNPLISPDFYCPYVFWSKSGGTYPKDKGEELNNHLEKLHWELITEKLLNYKGEAIFSKVEMLENVNHHLDIYKHSHDDGKITKLLIATK